MAIIVFDIDGVLADATHREHHLQKAGGPDWEAFFADCGEDTAITAGAELLSGIVEGLPEIEIVLLSGRSQSCIDETRKWLLRHIYARPYQYGVHLRPIGDHRADHIYKGEIIKDLHEGPAGPVLCVIDDSQAIIDTVLYLGIPALHFRRPGASVNAARG